VIGGSLPLVLPSLAKAEGQQGLPGGRRLTITRRMLDPVPSFLKGQECHRESSFSDESSSASSMPPRADREWTPRRSLSDRMRLLD
jgi:hypothetical protein